MGEFFGDKSALSLFKRGYKHGAFDEEVDGPLHWAIQEKFIEAALYLIQEAGEDINRLDSNQRSPLEVALEKKLFDVFKALVENKADVNLVGANNRSLLDSALDWALEKDYLDIFKALLKNRVCVNFSFFPKVSILHKAVRLNKYEFVEMLIKRGTNIHCFTQSNHTPLHFAAIYFSGATDIAKILIKWGADVNAKTNALQRPLHFASAEGHQEVVKLLLENGANPNKKDIDNNEPIHYASLRGQSQCVEILIQHGVDLNTRGQHSFTPLQFAIYASQSGTAQIFLKYGTSFISNDPGHFFPIERAMANKNLDIFKLLVFFEPLTKRQ